MPILFIVIPAILLFFAYSVYITVVRKKNAVEEAFSGIDVQLTKRHDLIPNLIATAKKFMTHEKTLMAEITELRTEAMKVAHGKDIKKAIDTENELGGKISQLLVNTENYPDLKSDAAMTNVQNAFADVEEHIAASRRFYNSAVRSLNDTIQIWPMSMIASMVKVKPYPYFEANKDAEEVPDAEKMFS